MEIQGPFSQLTQRQRVGGGRRPLAAHLPALARQLDRGRHHRDPAQHHRRARARPPERLGHELRLQRRAGAAAEHRAQILRERVRLRHGAPRSWRRRRASSPELWTKLAEQGWLGLVYPEAYDGIGLGLVDLVVLMEEMGRAVVPGPYFSTVLLGGLAILEAGSDGAEEGVAAEDRRGRPAGHARVDGAERAARRPPGSRCTAVEKGGRLHALRHQALRATTPTPPTPSWWRRARGRGRARTGVSLFLAAQGHAGARGHAAPHHGPDPQALRGHALRRRRSAPTR